MNKGDILELDIFDLNNMGAGVGRAEDGRVVFVRGCVGGDRAKVEVIKINKSYAVARLVELILPSPHRAKEIFCDAPAACGGCVYRNIDYSYELEIKREQVRGEFIKAGMSDIEILPTVSTGRVCGYRNKGQFPVKATKNGMRAGLFSAGTHTVIPFSECSIQNPEFSRIAARVCRFADEHGISAYDEKSHTGLIRHIYLRIAERTGEIMLCIVINGNNLPASDALVRIIESEFPSVKSLMLNINTERTNVVLGKRFIKLSGKDHIEDELCGLHFRISADSFYQVNRDGAEVLYGLAASLGDFRGDELLLDLYCGTGTIGLSVANRVKEVVGIEIVEAAVKCATENAERNGIANARFVCADASSKEVILESAGGRRPDAIIIDPPRKGSTRELIECIAELGVPKVVYVSCAPDTLARDCAHFREMGYEIGAVQPVDMFPRTGHVESVVCLKRLIQQ